VYNNMTLATVTENTMKDVENPGFAVFPTGEASSALLCSASCRWEGATGRAPWPVQCVGHCSWLPTSLPAPACSVALHPTAAFSDPCPLTQPFVPRRPAARHPERGLHPRRAAGRLPRGCP
jgi:hypothetical protein